MTGVQAGALAGFEAFPAIARVNTIGGLATFPLMVAGVGLWPLALPCPVGLSYQVVYVASAMQGR